MKKCLKNSSPFPNTAQTPSICGEIMQWPVCAESISEFPFENNRIRPSILSHYSDWKSPTSFKSNLSQTLITKQKLTSPIFHHHPPPHPPYRKTLIKSPQDRNQGDPPLSSQLIAPQIAVTVGSRKNAWLHVNFCQRTGWTCWLASICTAGSTKNLRDTSCHSFSSAAIGK